MNDEVRCTCCQRHKFKLRRRLSKLTGKTMYLCDECFTAKHEPRWAIIITAQDSPEGVEAVKSYLVGNKYHGAEIKATDLIK